MGAQARMGNDEVENDGLEFLSMRRYRVGRYGGDEEAGVGDAGGIASVATDDAEDAGTGLPGKVEAGDQVHADAVFGVAASDGEDEDRIAAAEPVGVGGLPAVVVDAGGQLGDAVGRRVALDAGDFAEVADRMAGVCRASAHTEEENTALLVARFNQQRDHALDDGLIEQGRDAGYLAEVVSGVAGVVGVGHKGSQKEDLRSMRGAAGRECTRVKPPGAAAGSRREPAKSRAARRSDVGTRLKSAKCRDASRSGVPSKRNARRMARRAVAPARLFLARQTH